METKVVTTNEKINTVPVVQSKNSQVKDLLIKHADQFQQALPKHIRADHFIRTALTCINKTPKLLECSIPSLMGALLTSAQLGLNPDGILGEAYLIPFKNNKKLPNGQWQSVMEVQFIPGYRGLVQLAQRSGQVKSFQARDVYENDMFEFEYGLEPRLVHVPLMKGDRGKLIYVYAVIQFTNGGSSFEVMSKDDVEMIRMKSKAPDSPAWKEHFSEMARKTVIRKISKMCPLSAEFNKAIGLDETAEFIGTQKNDREVLNYNFDQSITGEVEEAIHTDIVSEDVEQAEAKEEKKVNKVNDAMQQTLDKIAEKKKPAKEKEPEEVTPYAYYSELISNASTLGELEDLKDLISHEDDIDAKDFTDLVKMLENKIKKMKGTK